MELNEYCATLKKYLVQDLRLEHLNPEDIQDDMSIFGQDGLELDSLDAVELVVIVDKRFGVKIKDPEEARKVFQSPKTLAQFIMDNQTA